MNKTCFGKNAEILALKFLKQNNLTLIKQNFYSRFGEIDLIMQDLDTIVFVEVRMRKLSLDEAIASVTLSKQNKLIKTAKYFLSTLPNEVNCRFDLVAIDGNNNLRWLKNII